MVDWMAVEKAALMDKMWAVAKDDLTVGKKDDCSDDLVVLSELRCRFVLLPHHSEEELTIRVS